MMTKSGTRKQSRVDPKLSEAAKHLHIPDGIVSTGWPAVRDRCSQFGVGFDRWQDGFGRLMLAKDKDGVYVSAVGGVTASIPRQVGKTFTIGAIVFAMCVNDPGMTVLWTAHRGQTAGETFDDMQSMAARKNVKPHVRNIRRAAGEEAIVFANGSRILFGAREQGFGRGFTDVSVIVFDEAQILTERALDDMVPATNSIENALVIKVGTPPKPENPGEVFKRARRSALAGTAKNSLYVEFGADDNAKPNDWEQIGKANPSFLNGRTSKTAILRMRENLSEESFIREAMGVWDKEHEGLKAFDFKKWQAGYLKKSQKPPRDGRRCYGVRFSIDGSSVALAAAIRPKTGPVFVESVKIASMSDGTDWLVDWLLERHRRASHIVIDGKYASGYLVNALKNGKPGKPGIKNKRTIITPTVGQVIEAHATFDQAVKQGRFSTTSQEPVEDQVLAAERRLIGRDGGFGWTPPDGGSVVLIEAMTYAFWAAETTRMGSQSTPPKVHENSPLNGNDSGLKPVSKEDVW